MRIWLAALLAACSSPSSGTETPDAGRSGSNTGSGTGSGSGSGTGSADDNVISTLTSPCATLQGRALVSNNGNFGIAFTDADSPYTFRGSVQFQLPDGFTGAAPDPESWDGESDRHVVAMTTAGFDLHGNHCWSTSQPSGGSLVIEKFQPHAGIVKATFSAFALHSCTDATVCTVSGSIETKGQVQ